MFKKLKLKKQIKISKSIIESLEKKRERSQAEIVSAIISSREPNDQDVDFFNKYTAQIDAERQKLRELIAELEAL